MVNVRAKLTKRLMSQFSRPKYCLSVLKTVGRGMSPPIYDDIEKSIFKETEISLMIMLNIKKILENYKQHRQS